jgi:hypothetical protein
LWFGHEVYIFYLRINIFIATDLNLKILKDDSSCPGACQVIKWVKGCFDAIEKKYVSTLYLSVFHDCIGLQFKKNSAV